MVKSHFMFEKLFTKKKCKILYYFNSPCYIRAYSTIININDNFYLIIIKKKHKLTCYFSTIKNIKF